MMIRRWVIGFTVCLSVAATTGCSRSPRVNFYTLAPSAKPVAAASVRAAYAVAVGPVTLPEFVDRPQLVVRVAANRVDILETQRWAEPLKNGIPRLVAENLSRLLGTERVSSYPQNAGGDADYRVLLDIQRFESMPGESVTVEAFWTIRRTAGETTKTGLTVVREPVASGSYDALVAAYSQALVTVSSDIAQAIRSEESVAH